MAASRLDSRLSWVLTACLLFLLALFGPQPATGATCVRDTYSSLPAGPVFPTQTLSSSLVPSGRVLIKNHWSEVAQYSKYRPAKVTPSANPPQSGCPHLDQPDKLKDWHATSTWTGGSVPANGSDVAIPANTRVLVSSCSIDPTFVFKTITIPAGSALILGDAQISIAAAGFDVQGEFLVGSPTCRLRNKLTITLHGSRSAQALPANPPVKGIAASGGGRVDIHGVRYFTTWSRLAMTAEKGDSYLFIQDMVNWQPGQSIFITSTEIKDSRDWHRNEVRTIVKVYRTSLDSSVAAIQLDAPLDYQHYGGREYQAEVGLLTRNIVVRGDPFNSEPTDTANAVCKDATTNSTYPCSDKYLTGFGGHVQVIGQGSTGRFSGVELYRMGQTNVLGRYPLHWHLVNTTDPTSNFATDCSVHNSFFRCYTIHGTHGVRLAENTAYDAIGNCFYLSENGVEENNTIQYNLAAHVHVIGNIQDASDSSVFYGQYLAYYTASASLLIPADMSAAPFYATNMYNTIEGNAASGGWTGFSFPNLPAPIADFKNVDNMNPANRPFKTPFRGNTAHSSGFWWASASAFYFGGEMTYTDSSKTTLQYTEGRANTLHDTCTDKTAGTPKGSGGCYDLSQQLWLDIEDNKAFLTNRGLQAWGNRANIVRFEIHDAVLSMNVFGKVWIDQMLMDCRSSHRPAWFAGCPSAGNFTQTPSWNACQIRDTYFWRSVSGFQWYDVGQSHILQNSVFRNCRNDWSGCVFGSAKGICSGSAVFTSLSHSDQFVPQLMQATSGIKYDNCNNIWRFSTKLTDKMGETVSGRMQSWLDADGTASGTGRRTMIGSAWADEWWKMHSSCKLVAERWVCPMDEKDSSAALKFRYNAALEAQIGSSICLNGNSDGTKNCTVVGKATVFGRNESLGVDVAVMGQLTGPIVYKAGGWFVRYTAGTPNVLNLTEIQVDPKDSLVLAFPYPAGTKFNIFFQGASWCSTSWAVCTHPFRNVSSVAEVANGFGDVYYWDNAAQVLYVRATMQPATFGSPGKDAPWTSIPPAPGQFTRGGLTLPLVNGGPLIVIKASCSTNPCTPQPRVSVPGELRPYYTDSNEDSSAANTQPLLSTLARALL